MGMQIFSGRGKNGEIVRLPLSYRRKVKWLPQLGDIFPDFTTETTAGPIRFHDWAEGHWSFLFGHPGAFTPICSTELAGFAAAAQEFEQRSVKLLAVSGDDVQRLRAWRADVEDIFDVEIGFPSASDSSGILAEAFGMIHPKQSQACAIRKSFLIDPELKLRMIFEYPRAVGRSTDEVLRVIDALQAFDRYGLGTPADWQPGDDMLVPPCRSVAESRAIYGERLCSVREYLNVVSVREDWYRPSILLAAD